MSKPRVKGNLQSASSTRSGGNSGGINAFAASSSNASNLSIDNNLQFILKKLTKRDAVTKTKALDELLDYLESSNNLGASNAMLPLWPKLFAILVLDVDRRVRLRTLQAHAKIVSSVGKELASQLKKLIVPWICATFDSSREIALVAENCFKA